MTHPEGRDFLSQETTNTIAYHVSEILKALGEDITREGLVKTPQRVAESFQFLTHGKKLEDHINNLLLSSIFENKYDEIVLVKDIEFYSLCEHHLLPFFGKVHIGYIPNGKVIGLSKLPRLVEVFARRLQIQEQMTMQIRDALQHYLNPQGVGVVIEAQHLCMMARGVQKHESKTITSALSGIFLENSKTREEFMQLIRSK